MGYFIYGIMLPDNFETIKATEILAKEGFVVMPYMYPDLNVARDLANAGATCLRIILIDARRHSAMWKRISQISFTLKGFFE